MADKEPATEQLFLELRFGVLSGHYPPGQALAREALCSLYGLNTVAVTEVLNTLVLEGYLTRAKPGHYAVKAWSRNEIEDLYEMRASLEGIAVARAAERASEAEIAVLQDQIAAAQVPLLPGEGPERTIHHRLRFHAEIMKMAKIPALPDMARTFLPNALNRRICWSLRAGDLQQSLRSRGKIGAAIAERNAAMARLLMREEVFASREAVLAEIDALGNLPCPPEATIERLAGPFAHNGQSFGLGTREAAADGKLIPLRTLAG